MSKFVIKILYPCMDMLSEEWYVLLSTEPDSQLLILLPQSPECLNYT